MKKFVTNGQLLTYKEKDCIIQTIIVCLWLQRALYL